MSFSYEEFINSKRHTTGNFGFEPVFIPSMAFDFQQHIIAKAVLICATRAFR